MFISTDASTTNLEHSLEVHKIVESRLDLSIEKDLVLSISNHTHQLVLLPPLELNPPPPRLPPKLPPRPRGAPRLDIFVGVVRKSLRFVPSAKSR